jgi:predicted metal-dependent phosphoesterase TrpH
LPPDHGDPKIDLHLHTVASDGTLTAEELVLRAKSLGVAAIAITDHDSIGAVADGLVAGRRHGVEVVPGVEIGIAHDPQRGLVEVDILGYFIDPDSCEIRDTMQRLQDAKNAKLIGQVDVLAANGYEIEAAEVVKEAEGDTVRRPHIWKVLSRHHPDLPAEEFFDRTSYGGDWHVAKTFSVSLEECVKLIRRAGGVPVLAHPGAYNTTFARGGALIDPAVDTTVEVCAAAGVGGIEVYYTYSKNRPFHNGSSLISDAEFEQLVGHYLSLTHLYDLLPTGGTDFHGSSKPHIEIGEIEIPYRLLLQLKQAAVRQ